jgi:hypothetical protein
MTTTPGTIKKRANTTPAMRSMLPLRFSNTFDERTFGTRWGVGSNAMRGWPFEEGKRLRG